VEVVASLSQGRTAAAQCGLFTYNSVPVIFEPPCTTANSVVVKRKILTMTNGDEMRQQVGKKTDLCVIRNKYIT